MGYTKEERKNYSHLYYQLHKEKIIKNVREWQEKNPEKVKQIRINADIKKRIIHSDHVKARVALNGAVRSGKVVKGVCEVCGDPHVEGHHFDYTQPFKVNWLCPKHHREWEKNRTSVHVDTVSGKK
jgi:hypothetical protein